MTKSSSKSDSTKETTVAEVLSDVSKLAIEKAGAGKKPGSNQPSVFGNEPAGADTSSQYEEVGGDKPNPDAGKVAGYDPVDIAKAPLAPPTPASTDTKADTNNKPVKILVGLGAILAALGLFVVFFAFVTGVVLMFVGAALAVVAVFAPIRPKKPSEA